MCQFPRSAMTSVCGGEFLPRVFGCSVQFSRPNLGRIRGPRCDFCHWPSGRLSVWLGINYGAAIILSVSYCRDVQGVSRCPNWATMMPKGASPSGVRLIVVEVADRAQPYSLRQSGVYGIVSWVCKKLLPLSERLVSLGIMGDQLRVPLEPLNTIVLWWSEGLQGSWIGPPCCRQTLVSRKAIRLIAVVCPV